MAAAPRRWAAATAIVLPFVLVAPAAAAPGDVMVMSDSTLTSTGGLAADPVRGVYWTMNSHEASGVVHAVASGGQVVGQVTFDAAPTAVEGLAVLDSLIYVGDIGDPDLTRQSITVYRLEGVSLGSDAPYSQWTLHYPDGPHDAETMMVSPRGNIYIVTKGDPGGVYYVIAPDTYEADLTMERLGDAPAWVTDGAFLDSETAVVRTYTSVLVMNMFDFTVSASAATPSQPAGESLSTTLDGSGLLLGSKDDLSLVEAALPTSLASLPAAPSTPPGQAAEPSSVETTSAPDSPADTGSAASPSTGTTAADNPSSLTRRLTSTKTLAALASAVVVSIGAGALAYWWRGRR